MFEKIEAIMRQIEATNEEIRIILNMAQISFLDYVLIRRGEQERPEGLGEWTLQSIDAEVETLRNAIDQLHKIKREILTF